MTVYRIPLLNVPQKLVTQIGSSFYALETYYAPACNGEGGWFFNVSDTLGNRLLSGVPMVTGQDLLEPYAGAIGFDADLWVASAGDPGATPTETNLGQIGGANMYFAAPASPITVTSADPVTVTAPVVVTTTPVIGGSDAPYGGIYGPDGTGPLVDPNLNLAQ